MSFTHFGFKKVKEELKDQLVHNVFSDVASKYDVMNDIMSFGLHHMWKNRVIDEIRPSSEDRLLDVASGTGDISIKFLKAGGGKVDMLDINQDMLDVAKSKIDKNHQDFLEKISWHCASAEELPFDDNTFDYYTVSFGIRNVAKIDKALKEAYRVLKPGGKFICLELSNIENPVFKKLYDFYSFAIIPKIGKCVTGKAEHYQYLVESIRQFPLPSAFESMIQDAGFSKTRFYPLSFGVVNIHTGMKVS